MFVCVCLNSIISISKQHAALKVGDLRQTVVLYKIGKFFQVSMAHTVCKFENKKTITIQISHERCLNQGNGSTLPET